MCIRDCFVVLRCVLSVFCDMLTITKFLWLFGKCLLANPCLQHENCVNCVEITRSLHGCDFMVAMFVCSSILANARFLACSYIINHNVLRYMPLNLIICADVIFECPYQIHRLLILNIENSTIDNLHDEATQCV